VGPVGKEGRGGEKKIKKKRKVLNGGGRGKRAKSSLSKKKKIEDGGASRKEKKERKGRNTLEGIFSRGKAPQEKQAARGVFDRERNGREGGEGGQPTPPFVRSQGTGGKRISF